MQRDWIISFPGWNSIRSPSLSLYTVGDQKIEWTRGFLDEGEKREEEEEKAREKKGIWGPFGRHSIYNNVIWP